MSQTNQINMCEHLKDDELTQIMEIASNALDRAYEKGFITGDIDNAELSVKFYVPNNNEFS